MPRFSLLASAFALVLPLAAQEHLLDETLEVTSALAPGLVKHPVMAAFDDKGRLFVAENAGVNLNKEELLAQRPSAISLLEDTDGDGVFDKATRFAEGLTFPQGALWVYDSLYVMSPPSLWRFADEDGDGRAEVREELATGFDFTGNAADVHGPFLHPNGRLYWLHGRKGFSIPDNDTGQIMEQGKSARLWSAQLSGGEVESFAAGGMDNPVEVDFTDEGEILGTVNLFYGRPRGDVLVHWVHGGVYPRFDQGQVLAELRRTGELLPHVHNFGHVAVSGMARYRSGALNPDWADGWLVTHFNTGEITLTTVEAKGSTYVGKETRTLLRTLKPDTHFTDILEDRNGDLLVLDTGGWFRNGCPTSQIAKPEVAGTIYRVSRKGIPYQAPQYPDWARLSSEQVSNYLGAPEDWLRERAITELAVRGAPALPELERILTGGASEATARKNAVWTLARMKFSESADLIHQALSDPDAGVRQTACNAIAVTRTWQIVAANQPAERDIELQRNQTISGALAEIVRGDEPAVARAAAAALGRMAERRAIGAISGRLGRGEDDRFLEHALIYALIEIGDAEATREGLQSENPRLLSGLLRALDAMPESKLEVLDVLPFLESQDEGLRETALNIAATHHEWDAALANAFFDWGQEIDDSRRALLRRLLPAFAASPPMADYLTSLIVSEEASLQQLGLELLALAPEIAYQEAWTPLFQRALDPAGQDEALLTVALAALRSARTGQFAELVEAICADAQRPAALRLAAAEASARPKGPLPAAAFDFAEETLLSQADPLLRGGALSLLTQAALNAEQRDRLVSVLAKLNPVEWASFPELYRQLDSADQARRVAEALVSSPAVGNFDPELLRKRFAAHTEALAQLEARIAELAREREGRSLRIDELVAAMDQAKPSAGAEVFASGKGACVVCHRAGGVGGAIGPDLSTIGRIRTAGDLYESILYPSESIARDFDTYEVVLKSGAVRTGLIHGQTAQALDLVNPAGQKEAIPHREVATIRRIPTSLMPMGLEQTLSAEELRDLVAWLLEQK